jgi:hypothetical protein
MPPYGGRRGGAATRRQTIRALVVWVAVALLIAAFVWWQKR